MPAEQGFVDAVNRLFGTSPISNGLSESDTLAVFVDSWRWVNDFRFRPPFQLNNVTIDPTQPVPNWAILGGPSGNPFWEIDLSRFVVGSLPASGGRKKIAGDGFIKVVSGGNLDYRIGRFQMSEAVSYIWDSWITIPVADSYDIHGEAIAKLQLRPSVIGSPSVIQLELK